MRKRLTAPKWLEQLQPWVFTGARVVWTWSWSRLTFVCLWSRARVNVVLRRDSLRHLSNAEIERSLGSGSLWQRHPRWVSIGLAGIAVLVSVVPWSRWFGKLLPLDARTPSLITVISALLSVEAVLFTLTAAITAFLVNLAANRFERSLLISRYRTRAFDAAAVLSVITIVLTANALMELTRAEKFSLSTDVVYLRSFLLFAFDVIALAWLLYYSHVLITQAAWESAAHLVQSLRDSFRQAALQEVSGQLLEEWGQGHGLAPVSLAGAFPPNLTAVHARRTAYLHDVGLDRLAVWLHSLNAGISAGSAVRAIVQLRLDADVNESTTLAAVSPADASHGPAILRALRWKSLAETDSFPDELGVLQDNAVSAARSGRLADFRLHLSELHRLLNEVFRLAARASGLKSQWLTHVLGWQPVVQLNIALNRLGADILSVESPAVIRAWLYFPQQLLQESRHFPGREVRRIFEIWQQAASRGNVPSEWSFWLRLSEYTNLLNAALEHADTRGELARIVVEAYALLHAYRGMIVALKPAYFSHVKEAIQRIGEYSLRTWSGSGSTDDLASARREFALAFLGLAKVFWLGYAGWVFRQREQGRLSEEDMVEQWETIREQFETLDELWLAWRTLEDNDPLQWDFEQARDRLAEAEAIGRVSAGGFVEPHASSTVPFILLALTAPGPLSHDDQANALLQTDIEPYLQDMLKKGPAQWSRLIGQLSPQVFADRINGFRQRIAAS